METQPQYRYDTETARQEAGISKAAFEACVEAAAVAVCNHRSSRRIAAAVVVALRQHYTLSTTEGTDDA